MTARDVKRGSEALATVKKLCPTASVELLQLDLDDLNTIQKCKAAVKKKYQTLDILVNNAGMAYKGASTAPFSEQAEVTIKANYTGTMNVISTFLDIIPENGRVVTVSSMAHR